MNRSIVVLSMIICVFQAIPEVVADPFELSMLHGSWVCQDESDKGYWPVSFVVDENNIGSTLYENEHGFRQRSDCVLEFRDDTLYLGDSPVGVYEITEDILSCDWGRFQRSRETIDPDSWVRYLTPLDSVVFSPGDITYDGNHILQWRGWLCRYSTSPLALEDSIRIENTYLQASAIEWEDPGLWTFRDSFLVCLDIATGEVLSNGPSSLLSTAITSDGETFWYYDHADQTVYTFQPPSRERSVCIDLNEARYIGGMAWHDGSLFICMNHMLYRYSPESGEILDVYAYHDYQYPLPRHFHSIGWVASVEDELYVLIRESDQMGAVMLCRIQL